MIKTVLQNGLREDGGGSSWDHGSGGGRHCGWEKIKWEARVIAEGWMGRKSEDGGKDDQRGQLIKGTRNPEP